MAAPSKPFMTDQYEPTNGTLWEAVLDVARGKKREMTQGDRTIHAPNEGKGYFPWPHPLGSAWAVKQYKGFGGAFRKKREAARAIPVDRKVVQKLAEKTYKEVLRAFDRWTSTFPADKPISLSGAGAGKNLITSFVARIDLKTVRGTPVGPKILVSIFQKPHGGVSKFVTKASWGHDHPPKLLIYLDGTKTPSEFRSDHFMAIANLAEVINHEFVHARDFIHKKELKEYAEAGAAGFEAYINQPIELRAFLRQIVDEAIPKAHMVMRFLRGKPKPSQRDFFEQAISKSKKLQKIRPLLTKANEQYVLKALYREFDDAGIFEKFDKLVTASQLDPLPMMAKGAAIITKTATEQHAQMQRFEKYGLVRPTVAGERYYWDITIRGARIVETLRRRNQG